MNDFSVRLIDSRMCDGYVGKVELNSLNMKQIR